MKSKSSLKLMSQVQIRIPSDGSIATFVKGSYHIHHAGVTYLNKAEDSQENDLVVLPENTTAEILDGNLHVVGFGKKKHIFKPAQKVEIEVKKMSAPGNVATLVAGSFELHLNNETYFLKTNAPFYSIPRNITAFLEGTTVRVVYIVGRRCIRTAYFEKVDVEKISSKRKEMESEAEKDYIEDEKRVKTQHSNAGRTLVLANKAIDAIKELIEFEKTMVEEAAAAEFEDEDEPLEKILSVFEAVKTTAEEFSSMPLVGHDDDVDGTL